MNDKLAHAITNICVRGSDDDRRNRYRKFETSQWRPWTDPFCATCGKLFPLIEFEWATCENLQEYR